MLPEWPFVLANNSMVSPTLVNFVVMKPSILIISPVDKSSLLGATSSATIGCNARVNIKKTSKYAGFRIIL